MLSLVVGGGATRPLLRDGAQRNCEDYSWATSQGLDQRSMMEERYPGEARIRDNPGSESSSMQLGGDQIL